MAIENADVAKAAAHAFGQPSRLAANAPPPLIADASETI
jgi:hypothetical protein